MPADKTAKKKNSEKSSVACDQYQGDSRVRGKDKSQATGQACSPGEVLQKEKKRPGRRTGIDRVINPNQERFRQEYLVDLNATQAAIRAGYSEKSAPWIGPQLLKKPHIAAAIQADMDKRSEKTDITKEKVLKEIARLSFADLRHMFDEHGRLLPIHMLPPDISASISSIKVKTTRIPGTDPVEVENIAEIKLWDKRGSLELLGKHLKLFNEVGSAENPLSVQVEMTAVQRAARLSAILIEAKKRAEEGK